MGVNITHSDAAPIRKREEGVGVTSMVTVNGNSAEFSIIKATWERRVLQTKA